MRYKFLMMMRVPILGDVPDEMNYTFLDYSASMEVHVSNSAMADDISFH